MPYPIAVVRVQAIYGTVPRLNYDKSITPHLLVHAGVGYQRFHNPDSSPPPVLQYDAVGQLGDVYKRQRQMFVLLMFQYAGYFLLIIPINWWYRQRAPAVVLCCPITCQGILPLHSSAAAFPR